MVYGFVTSSIEKKTTEILFYRSLKYYIWKHDFSFQRKIHALNYSIKDLLYFFYEKLKKSVYENHLKKKLKQNFRNIANWSQLNLPPKFKINP